MRTFLSFEVDSKLTEELYFLIGSYKNYKNIKWVEKENLHITLQFIGDTEYRHILDMDDIFSELFQKIKSFKILKSKIEIMPYKKPKIIWLRVDTDSLSVFSTIQKLQGRLASLGYSFKNRSKKLHITLGRIKKRLPFDFFAGILSEKIVSVPSPVNKIIFYESVLKKTGPQYFPIKTYNLL